MRSQIFGNKTIFTTFQGLKIAKKSTTFENFPGGVTRTAVSVVHFTAYSICCYATRSSKISKYASDHTNLRMTSVKLLPISTLINAILNEIVLLPQSGLKTTLF